MGTRKSPQATACKKPAAKPASARVAARPRTVGKAVSATPARPRRGSSTSARRTAADKPARDTRSGIKFEHVLTGIALRKHYSVRVQETLPDPLFKNGTYKIDLVVTTPQPIAPTRSRRAKPHARIGISAKKQSVSGSADEKIPAEILRLAGLVKSGVIDRGYLVLGGNGSANFARYLAGESRIPGQERVGIISEGEFRSLVARHAL